MIDLCNTDLLIKVFILDESINNPSISLDTLLGTPVHQVIYVNIKLANHVATIQCIKACRHGQEVLLFSPKIRMGMKCEPSDFDCEMI